MALLGIGQGLTQFPHTRGDEPLGGDKMRHPIDSFPTPVGMNRIISGGTLIFDSFPTPVGMNRRRCRWCAEYRKFPHTRGDEPAEVALFPAVDFSFPTPVGMNRGAARKI